MKSGVVGAIALFCALAASSAVQAKTCEGLANNCVRNGGLQAECHAAWRITKCKKTGLYTAPSGRVWNTKAKCVGGDCAGYRGR